MNENEKDEKATIPEAAMPGAIAEWNAPPVAEGKVGESIAPMPAALAERRGFLEPTDEAKRRAVLEGARWAAIDTERMTGVVPHLVDGGLQEHPVVSVNDQVTECPFFDSGDGLWGGVNLGDTVAFYGPGAVTWLPALVIELRHDAEQNTCFAKVVFFGGPSGMGVSYVPHQAARAPGGACWAHKTEQFTITGRIAAEVKLGVGGASYEEARALEKLRQEQSDRVYIGEPVEADALPTPLEMHIVTCDDCAEQGDAVLLCDRGLEIRLAEQAGEKE